MPQQSPNYDAAALTNWAAAVFERATMEPAKAATVAAILVEGDLLGHDTHGLALLGPYLKKLADGGMQGTGDVEVVSDKPAAVLWDGRMLPGPWLTSEAIRIASERADTLGTATVVIKNSGHIACLAAYLETAARNGKLVEIYSSDPSVASVAPFGGTEAVFTPNPLAVGIPTGRDPILIDISTSITTNGMSARLEKAGKRFEKAWLLDGHGTPTTDPAAFHADPPGTIQLVGGLDYGHKGYGLTLMVEAFTGGLAGHGRADGINEWGATVMVRVTDTEAFAGAAASNRQLDWIVDACRNSRPIDPNRPVRLPGQAGLARKAKALEHGLSLATVVQDGVEAIASEHQVQLPQPI